MQYRHDLLSPVRLATLTLLTALTLTACGEQPPPPTGSRDAAQPAASVEHAHSHDAGALPAHLPVLDQAALDALAADAAAEGEVLVVDFWATWCVPCVALFPQVHAAMEEFEGVRFISLTSDEVGGETEQKAIRFLQKQHALDSAYILKADSDEQTRMADALQARFHDFNILAVPAYLVYDKQGKPARAIGGGSAFDLADIIEAVTSQIAATPSS